MQREPFCTLHASRYLLVAHRKRLKILGPRPYSFRVTRNIGIQRRGRMSPPSLDGLHSLDPYSLTVKCADMKKNMSIIIQYYTVLELKICRLCDQSTVQNNFPACVCMFALYDVQWLFAKAPSCSPPINNLFHPITQVVHGTWRVHVRCVSLCLSECKLLIEVCWLWTKQRKATPLIQSWRPAIHRLDIIMKLLKCFVGTFAEMLSQMFFTDGPLMVQWPWPWTSTSSKTAPELVLWIDPERLCHNDVWGDI